jgi:hypothetical protein
MVGVPLAGTLGEVCGLALTPVVFNIRIGLFHVQALLAIAVTNIKFALTYIHRLAGWLHAYTAHIFALYRMKRDAVESEALFV